MTEKLLHKTLRKYALFFIITFSISAPLFYFYTEKIYLEDADETLFLRRNEFLKWTLTSMKKNEISIWNKISKDGKIEISTLNKNKANRVYFESEFDKYTNENEPYHILKTPISIEGERFNLVLRVNLIEAEDLIISTVGLFVFIILVLLVGFYIITKRLTKTLWKPFYETLSQIEQFEIDKDKTPHFTPTKIEEFNQLNNNITKLIEKNTQIYRSQREFVENAAHELQTPLSIFQFTIDSLMQLPDITTEQSELIFKLNETVGRLNRLNKNLLLLSKIEGNQFENSEIVDLNLIFEKQLDFFSDQAKAKNIKIATQLDSKFLVKSNNSLIEILISNLFLNSIKHNVENGEIKITLKNNSLTFSNTGPNKSIDSEKIYKRFSKINPSTHGNGLGLSIIKKIVDTYNWSIHYHYSDNLHEFEIKFNSTN